MSRIHIIPSEFTKELELQPSNCSTKFLPLFFHLWNDIHIEVTPVPVSQLNKEEKAENSAAIRERVVAARTIQTVRFANTPGVHCNAQMGSKLTRQYCVLTDECRNIMEMAMNRLGLSARAYDRILRVARTIADLEAAPDINPDHLREAITYRSLDRDSWGR